MTRSTLGWAQRLVARAPHRYFTWRRMLRIATGASSSRRTAVLAVALCAPTGVYRALWVRCNSDASPDATATMANILFDYFTPDWDRDATTQSRVDHDHNVTTVHAALQAVTDRHIATTNQLVAREYGQRFAYRSVVIGHLFLTLYDLDGGLELAAEMVAPALAELLPRAHESSVTEGDVLDQVDKVIATVRTLLGRSCDHG